MPDKITLYHGSRFKIPYLREGSFLTEDIERAKGYAFIANCFDKSDGMFLYKFEVNLQDVVMEIYSSMVYEHDGDSWKESSGYKKTHYVSKKNLTPVAKQSVLPDSSQPPA